jgi:prevent-host-death family protein
MREGIKHREGPQRVLPFFVGTHQLPGVSGVPGKILTKKLDGPYVVVYISSMKRASITEAKNHLSQLLEEVKSGTTILILERNRPVARLEPVAAEEGTNDERISSLVAQGLATAPYKQFDVASFLSREMVRLPAGASAVRALRSEREQGI